ncbi:MAG: hypothetical protein SFV52_11610 [Saprospiraceae bacterium]|nr:hypothetical protein [Saprospiraceae bacterium]
MRSLLTCLVLSFALAGVFAQPIQTFKKRYGTSGNDEARFVVVLPDNSFIIAGASTGGGLGGSDALLVKFSADGTVEWSKVFGGGAADAFSSLLLCSDGNLIALGETSSFGAGSTDIYVVKCDPSGNIIWQQTCGGASLETARGVCEVSDGYVVTGATQSFGYGFWDVFVEKLDLSGGSLWSKSWGNGGGDVAGEPFPAGGSDVWISGFFFVNSGNHDGFLMKLDADGDVVQGRRVTAPDNDGFWSLTTGGAGLIASGGTWSYGGNQSLPWLVSFNASGGVAWSRYFAFGSGNWEIGVGPCPDGGVIFTPFSTGGDSGTGTLVRTNNGGDVQWAKTFPFGAGNGRMFRAVACPDGGYLGVGYCQGNGREVFIIKTDADGNVPECCPEDMFVPAFVASPGSVVISPVAATGPGSVAGTGSDLAPGVNMTDLCNGPLCCLTDAGTLLGQVLLVCPNETATFTHLGDEVLDANDLLQFILFSNPADTLGSIVATINTPAFTYIPATMQTGVTYYVAAIAGNSEGGNVDLDDPCLDISGAAQLTWRPLPAVQLSLSEPDLCPGECTLVNAVLTGTPPYVLTVSIPGLGDQVYNFTGNTGGFVVCVPAGASPGAWAVEAIALQDLFCSCP